MPVRSRSRVSIDAAVAQQAPLAHARRRLVGHPLVQVSAQVGEDVEGLHQAH